MWVQVTCSRHISGFLHELRDTPLTSTSINQNVPCCQEATLLAVLNRA
jgi:hypothetical protein